jgi:tripartite-type tricarboxylate transporter receptor subunit TctC
MKEFSMLSRRSILVAGAGLLPIGGCGKAWAQASSSRFVRLVVPFSPGGTTDIVAHLISEKLSIHLGRQVMVENKPGRGGVVGSMELIQSAPDGHTLGLATASTTATNPAINPTIPYDPATDLTPIINLAATPNLIAVHPSFPARTYAEFLAEIKKNPGRYSYASSGSGSVGHLQTELFKTLTRTFILHVPYRGSGPGLSDTVTGQIPIIFDNVPSALPFIKEGRLVPVVVASPNRLAFLPSIPTFKEVGLEPVNRMAYYGLVGPKGLPRDVVEKVYFAAKKTLEDPLVRRRIEESGSVVVGSSPEQFAAQIRSELASYKAVVAQQRLAFE